MRSKSKGIVRWFDSAKGIGFITNESGNDVFVHFTAIVTTDDYKILKQGQQVEFVQVATDRRWKGVEVEAIETLPA